MSSSCEPSPKRQRLSSPPSTATLGHTSFLSDLGGAFRNAMLQSSLALPSPEVSEMEQIQNEDGEEEIEECDTEDESTRAPTPKTLETSPVAMDKMTNFPIGSQEKKPSARRSQEEIAALRRAALEKRKLTQEAKAREEDPLAKALAREQRDSKRRELATRELASFGFKVAGVSRFGSGKGGDVKPGYTSKTAEGWTPDQTCSDEQKEVLELVKQGGNVFYTGSAGVGKSFVLAEITRLLTQIGRPFQVTATTGIAALQVSGITTHSWAGIGLGKEPLTDLVDKIVLMKKQSEKRMNWERTQTLISVHDLLSCYSTLSDFLSFTVDEVSMIDPELFLKLDMMGKMIREDPRPFGGIQIILSGDFFQLPPVPEKRPKCIRCGHESHTKIAPEESTLAYEMVPFGAEASEIYRCSDALQNGKRIGGCGLEMRRRKFAFETEAWAECNFSIIELTKVFRQSDPTFIKVLEKFRRGICDSDCEELISQCGTALNGHIKIKPTNLYPLRRSVDAENSNEFQRLNQPVHTFNCEDQFRGERARFEMKTRLNDVPAAPTIRLKTGAQVLLLANLSLKDQLVNGSRGVIVDWVRASETERELTSEEKERQVELPKRRGGRSHFGGEEWKDMAAEQFLEQQEDDYLPIVFFASGFTKIIHPHTWVIDVDNHNAVARTQIPLALAWALTIHKSQGQSLDAVGVKLMNTFEKGQAYVALSRARTKEGMKVEGFKPSHIMANETVVAFYNRIAEKKAFRDGPSERINPLQFCPRHSPLVDRLFSRFGLVRGPLPKGSAAIKPRTFDKISIPPEKSTSLDVKPLASSGILSVLPSPSKIESTLLPTAENDHVTGGGAAHTWVPPPPVASPEGLLSHLPAPATHWEAMLRTAVEEYARSPSPAIGVFVTQATQLIALAIGNAVVKKPILAPTIPPVFQTYERFFVAPKLEPGSYLDSEGSLSSINEQESQETAREKGTQKKRKRKRRAGR